MTERTRRPARGLDGAAAALIDVLADAERDDLRDRAVAVRARLARPDTVVCVVGEFKQGKSSLVNGLVQSQVCPVDDDLATAVITVVAHGDEPGVVVRRRVDGEPVAEAVPVDDVGDWVSEMGNPDNHKGVERVDITVPSSLLGRGITLVDTPGMGGLGSGHAAATLSFLPFADGLVLTSDASAELSAPEIEFIKQAVEVCPTVIMAQTKTDLYPEGERIAEINEEHLRGIGIEIPIVAVSNHLRAAALADEDKELNDASNFPQLLRLLRTRIVDPAKEAAEERAVSEIGGMVELTRTSTEDALALLDDPASLGDAVAELEAAKERIEYLRGPAARWSVVLGDRISDLSSDANYRFRGEMRSISRSMDEKVETLKNAAEWDEMVRDLQSRVAEAATGVFSDLRDGWTATHQEIAEVIRDEGPDVSGEAGELSAVEVGDLWRGGRFKKGRSSLAAAQSVILMGQSYGSSRFMFSNLGAVSKFGISLGALATGPFIAAGVLVMGGIRVLEDRKRRLAARRQQARQQVRQFIDDVQFEVGNEITNVVRTMQREMRDEFGNRLQELQVTYAETARRAQEDAQRTAEELKPRREQLARRLKALDDIARRIGLEPA
jgi:GTPase SAR1 family protein